MMDDGGEMDGMVDGGKQDFCVVATWAGRRAANVIGLWTSAYIARKMETGSAGVVMVRLQKRQRRGRWRRNIKKHLLLSK